MTAIDTPLSIDALLYGQDSTTGIVAVEADYEEGVWVYQRSGDTVRRERAPYRPWMLLTRAPDFALPGADITELEGEGYRLLAEFTGHADYQAARFRLRDAHIEHLTYAGSAKMAMIRSGQTLFKGMTFDDIVRFQFDIETNGLDPEPEDARILLIAVSDNRGMVDLIEGDEPDILARFAALVRERDPDVIEGHNVYGFDLPYVMARCKRHNIRLSIGRDGSEPRVGQERNYAIGGNSRPYVPIYIHGRHVLDTYLVVQRFDWAKQALSSYGLKECARVFGFAEEQRVELPRAEIARIYREDPELVRLYARQDVIETRKLAELISPVEFYQAQMIPDNYGQTVVTGNGEKINSLFVRAYLAAGRAVARMRASRPYAGGYSEVRAVGVFDRIVKADVESLYPSLMLTHRLAPAADSLGIFLPLLRELTQRRFEAKRKAQSAENREALPSKPHAQAEELQTAADSGSTAPAREEQDFQYWDGLQGSYKVLINSFYGYLGGPFYWNDYDAAERVTELGRELVVDVADRMEAGGSAIIEIDTDGVYFVPPATVQGEPAERAYIQEIGAPLPEGIRLAFDGRYAAMLSLKTKNYVLVGYNGKRTFKGASLRSRADEAYGRKFLAKAIDCLLEHDNAGVGTLYAQTIDDILNRRIPIDDLARRERVTEKTFQSEQKRRSAAIAKNVAIGEYVHVYEKANGELGLKDEYAHDENVRYYMDKLYKFAKRLEEALDGDFSILIPKPTAQGLPHQAQTTLDLFG
ncbi:MAG: polymerase elongation subunit [Chthonomonadaceae bacterium]|nr:polymerase elongation subunit [Chthonomonadaceae bacterium]